MESMKALFAHGKGFMDHNPTEGGDDQGTLFLKLYEDTLKLYEYLFNQEPQTHIWETVEERFKCELILHQHVDLKRVAAFQDKKICIRKEQ